MKKHAAIATALILAIIGSALFIAAYFTGGDRLYEGLSLALAAAGLSAAALGWAFWIVPNEQVVDEIVTYPSSPGERVAESGEAAGELRQIGRPRMLVALLSAALASFAAALIVPIRSLGPAPDRLLFHTRWRKGDRIVREDGSLVHVDDLNVDSAITIFPEDALATRSPRPRSSGCPATSRRVPMVTSPTRDSARTPAARWHSIAPHRRNCSVLAINRSLTSLITGQSSQVPQITRCRVYPSKSAATGFSVRPATFPKPSARAFGNADDQYRAFLAVGGRPSGDGALCASRAAQSLSGSLVVHAR